MFRMMMLLVVAGGLSGLALFGVAQPPGEGGPGEGPPDGPPKGAKGGKGEKGPKGEGKFGSAKGKGKFQPGMVIPPHVVADLELSSEQNKSIKDLERGSWKAGKDFETGANGENAKRPSTHGWSGWF